MFKDKVLCQPLHHIFAEVWITVSIFSKLNITILGVFPPDFITSLQTNKQNQELICITYRFIFADIV